MNSSSRFVVLVGLALSSQALPQAHAQQTLQQVTVSATRTEAAPFDVPASVDVVDGERLRGFGRPELQLSEALATVPGISIRDRQNFAQDLQLSIRGFGARSTFGVRGVRLYVDGVPATMPDGQGQLSHFDLSSASRIEILRGPFSALYGNSSGGVVQLFTEPGEGPPVVTASLAAGSSGLVRPALRASGSSGNVSYTVSASHFSTDGWREHGAARRALFNTRLDWKPRDGSEWTLVANAVDIDAGDPLGLSRAQFEANPRRADPVALAFNTRKATQQSQLGLVHTLRIDSANTLRLMAYGGTRETLQFQSIPPGPQSSPLHAGGVIDLKRRYGGLDARWTRKSATLETVGGIGYDKLWEDRRGFRNFITPGPVLGVRGALRRDEDNTVSNLDPYMQAVWKPTAAWTFTGGLRHSTVRFASRDNYVGPGNGDDSGALRYSATLPALGVLWAASPQLHAYAGAGRGFETPTFNELAYRPDGVPGLNFRLRPARSDNYEIGLKGRSPPGAELRTEWSAAFFATDTRDEIVTQTNTGGRSTFRNAGATQRRGIELGWMGMMGAWQLQLAHTWLDARFVDSVGMAAAGNRIPGTAQGLSAAELSWAPAQGWRGGLELRHSSKVFVNDANSDAAPSFLTMAAFAGYRVTRGDWLIDASLRVDNLTGKRYAGSVIVNEGNSRFFEPAPGRQGLLKLTVTRAF